MSAVPPPDHVRRAARALGIPDRQLQPVAGASGQTWAAGAHFLRVRPRDTLRIELDAMAAAGSVLPTPRVLATAESGTSAAALLERVAGSPAGDLSDRSVAEAHAIGTACGRLHALLAEVRAPRTIPSVDSPGDSADGSANRLLHLDLHPFNVLVDDAGRVSAVLDWANAAAGRPELDRARTLSILTLDPAALKRRSDARWRALTEAWIAAGGLEDAPAHARMWACRYMLIDLQHRYREAELAHLHAALHAAESTP